MPAEAWFSRHAIHASYLHCMFSVLALRFEPSSTTRMASLAGIKGAFGIWTYPFLFLFTEKITVERVCYS
ncbi:hypothetical protein LEMLEM_LOCUS12661 [Lemmus lemmus]